MIRFAATSQIASQQRSGEQASDLRHAGQRGVQRGTSTMTKQKTPHTQTQQDVAPEQTDLEPGEMANEADSPAEQELYANMDGAETGEERSPRKVKTREEQRSIEPSRTTLEGEVSTRAPKRPSQGITSHSAEEESRRQQKVVNDRPDAQAGVNRSRRTTTREKSRQR